MSQGVSYSPAALNSPSSCLRLQTLELQVYVISTPPETPALHMLFTLRGPEALAPALSHSVSVPRLWLKNQGHCGWPATNAAQSRTPGAILVSSSERALQVQPWWQRVMWGGWSRERLGGKLSNAMRGGKAVRFHWNYSSLVYALPLDCHDHFSSSSPRKQQNVLSRGQYSEHFRTALE